MMIPIPYKYLETVTEGQYKSAKVVNLESGVETTFNHRLFKQVPENSCFYLDDKSKVIVISEEEIPQCIEKCNEFRKKRAEEAAHIRAEKEATGRFRWWSFPDTYREGLVWECEAERVADKVEDFWDATATVMDRPMIAEYLKKQERTRVFIEMAEEGDILEYVIAYRDPMAASGDLQILRPTKDDPHQIIAHLNLWKS